MHKISGLHGWAQWIGTCACVALLSACAPHADAPRNTDWSVLGNSAEMQHHSDLAEINADTIKQLGLAWWVEMPIKSGLVGNPLIHDGVVFQSGPAGYVFANDLRTGKLLWQFHPTIDLKKASFLGYSTLRFNRGVALWEDEVIVAADCRLFALDQKTGQQRWEAQSCDPTQFYVINAAPRVGEGLVFTGNACGDSGMTRGYVDAFDAKTGAHRWRFYTVPGDPSKPQESPLYEMAEKTWGKGWYEKTRGCASAWDAITYDPQLHQVYIGTAGPAPLDPTERGTDPGDELFTNSIVAVDAQTGAYKWHFKQTPHDGWDFDSSIGIMVADLPVNGSVRRTVLSVPKTGFAYVLDAATGQFISGGAYTPMNWAKGLDAQGRPIPDREAMYWLNPDKGGVVMPGAMGSHGWQALAFDPASKLLYIPAMVMPTRIAPSKAGVFMGTMLDFYYGSQGEAKWKPHGELVAWDPVANTVKWRVEEEKPVNGGLLHTAGGLVFEGMADGRLVAFDQATGKQVWSQQTGGSIAAAPSTVMVDGHQYLIVATGNGAAMGTGSFLSKYDSTQQSQTPPRLLAFRLGAHGEIPSLAAVEPTPKPPLPRQDAALAAKGFVLFDVDGCTICHGSGGAAVRGPVPNLNRMPPASYEFFHTVVHDGALSINGMPPFKEVPEADLRALFAYIINEAWNAYERDQAAAAPGPAHARP